MGLRSRIMLMVAVGLLIATLPLGIMGLAMVRSATDRILQERLAMAEATAAHLSARLARGWWQLDQIAARMAPAMARGDHARIQSDFEGIVPQIELFSGGAFLVDSAGRYLAGQMALREFLPADLLELDAVQQAVVTRRHQTQTMVSGPGKPALALLAAPVVRASSSRVEGVVVGIIDLNQPTLISFIRGLPVGTSGHAVIVARDGTVLTSTETAELFTREEHPEYFAALIEAGKAAVGPTEDPVGPGQPHARHVMAFAPLEVVPWGVGLGQTEEETFGQIDALRRRIVLFETAILLAALALAWWDTSAVVRPLRVLRGAAERIAEGDLAQVIDVQRSDEIGSLAQSFEVMRERLLRSLEENVRLQERLRSMAMVEERERLAREMHDSVGQVLGYVNTKVQAVRILLDAGRIADAEGHLKQLEGAAREAYGDLREAIFSLRTAPGPERPLLPVLRDYVRRFTEQTAVQTALVVEEGITDLPMADTAGVHLFRIVQEALANVRKHAAAEHATVRVETRPGVFVISIEDDGIGIAGPSEPMQGYGLHTMRERAEAVGGALAVTRRPDGGTVVQVVVPMREEPERANLAG